MWDRDRERKKIRFKYFHMGGTKSGYIHDLFKFFHYDCYQIKEAPLSKPNKVVIHNSSIRVKFRVETSIGSSTS